MKNKTAKTAKQVSIISSEKRIDIGEHTLILLSQSGARQQELAESHKKEVTLFNQIITASIEASGIKIDASTKINVDIENKQFIII